MARTRFTTPKGEAVYPWLNVPDSRVFNGTPSRPAYKVSLRLEGDDAETLKKIIDPVVEESYQKALEEAKPADKKKITKAYPYGEEYDEAGNETGAYLFKFKQNAELKTRTGDVIKVNVPLFDSKKKVMTEDIYGGSTIKVAFSTRPYFMASTKSAGISCDLSAVQVLELSAGRAAAGAFGFGEEDGFEGAVEVKATETSESAFEEIDDDDEF